MLSSYCIVFVMRSLSRVLLNERFLQKGLKRWHLNLQEMGGKCASLVVDGVVLLGFEKSPDHLGIPRP